MPTNSRGLEQHYAEIERGLVVNDRIADYSRLVVPNENSREPVHRWFHIKEAFSSALLPRLLKDSSDSFNADLRLLDPFAGGGTSLLSGLDAAQQSNTSFHGFGIERNPLLWRVARTKVQARIAGQDVSTEFRVAAGEVLGNLRSSSSGSTLPIPPSSTLRNEQYFPKQYLTNLLRLREAIQERGQLSLVSDLLMLCLVASVEPAGMLRRDGRALRFEAGRVPQDPIKFFAERAAMVIEDLNNAPAIRANVEIDLGDGRRPDLTAVGDSMDLILFSPPYPNNIDYTEVYKTEAWILGCYGSAEDMKAQRLSTVRSHPSVDFGESYWYEESSGFGREVDWLIDPLLSALPTDRYIRGRRRLVKGYVDDMFQVLTRSRSLVKEGGRLIFVVGNSAHGSGDGRFVIAADVLMCGLAKLAGWHVEEIRVSRVLSRRAASSNYLRESVVCLRA